MGFEQFKYFLRQSAASQQQSPEKHKLISHSKQKDKKPLRSYQFGSSADHLVIYVFAVRPKTIKLQKLYSYSFVIWAMQFLLKPCYST